MLFILICIFQGFFHGPPHSIWHRVWFGCIIFISSAWNMFLSQPKYVAKIEFKTSLYKKWHFFGERKIDLLLNREIIEMNLCTLWMSPDKGAIYLRRQKKNANAINIDGLHWDFTGLSVAAANPNIFDITHNNCI